MTEEAYLLWARLSDALGAALRVHGCDDPKTIRVLRALKRAEARWFRRIDRGL